MKLAGVLVRVDSEARYCLNDLHKAAGGDAKHKPVLWLRSKQAKALIAEVEAEGKGTNLHLLPIVTVKGRNGGTYASDDLLIAYAAWISAAFYLRVIRTFKRTIGIDLRSERGFYARRLALESSEAESKQRGTTGSGLMNVRRREKPLLQAQREALEAAMQPLLFPTP